MATGSKSDSGNARALRADAARNEDAVLEAAKALFAEVGVDAPVRDIAARAGVGMGTLYRRFPKRSDLIAAVLRREVDACVDEGARLAETRPPMAALSRWLERYADFLQTKKGLAVALRSGDAAFAALPDYFRERFEPVLALLLSAAAAAGEVRSDLDAWDLLRGIGNLSTAGGDDGSAHLQRMLRLLLAGLRSPPPASTQTAEPRARNS